MRLALLSEAGPSREFIKRIRKAHTPNTAGEGGGLFGIKKEFDTDFDTASKYSNLLGGGGYGENDIRQKELHHNRAPVNILKLLRHFNVSDTNIKKLVGFYLLHREIIKSHTRVPNDDEALRQLYAGEKLVAQVDSDRELKPGYITVPYYKDAVVYVLKKEDLPLVREIEGSHNKTKQDLLRGLAFGYRLEDVFNYVRDDDRDLVDSICGRVE